jgi:glycosyltransferase involved in cell wall biosynthesis
MKIGFIHYVYNNDSLKYFWGSSFDMALGNRHEVIHLPREFYNASKSGRWEVLQDLCNKCDVLMGEFYPDALECREKIGKPIPIIGNLSGLMSRGGGYIRNIAQYLKTTDIIIGNCAGDLGITKKFFSNAEMRILPFSFDEATFYPIEASQKQVVKASRGFSDCDKILLYSGRITIEKNVHTILGIFSVLQSFIPNLHLVIAGLAKDVPFYELGVFTMGIGNVLRRLADKLGIDQARLHFVGRVDGKDLRELYNITDALINLTIFHDENFGLAQVESMACGTPVIGTKWGGLQDTIIHGETGFHVSTFATPCGVKVNWWEAIDNISYLLSNQSEYGLFRQRSREHAIRNYSMGAFRKTLESILADCVEINNKRTIDPIELTPFGREFWETCVYRDGDCPPYRRGPRSFELYREMIDPFTGLTDRTFKDFNRLQPKSILCLASPTHISENGRILVDDPIFPFDLDIPDNYQDAIVSALAGFMKEPAMSYERLTRHFMEEFVDSTGAIAWMLDSGLVLCMDPGRGNVSPIGINPLIGAPLLAIQTIDYKTDVLALR